MIYWSNALWAITPLILGLLIGSLSQSPNSAWYEQLVKPSWTPPNWVFGPVWTALYLIMGLSAWIAFRQGQSKPDLRRSAIVLFILQLALNYAWTPLFLGCQRQDWALWDLGALCAVAAWTCWQFFLIDRLAGWLFAPYLVWIACAFALNWSICQSNPI